MNQLNLNLYKGLNFKSTQPVAMPQNIYVQKEAQVPVVELPAIYQNSQQENIPDFKERMKKADAMGIITPWFEHPLLTIGTAASLIWGLDKFSNACNGEYEKSLVGKASRLGDSIENSKFVQSRPVQGVLGGIKKTGKSVAYVFRNNQLVNAFKNTPAKPEWQMPKHEMLTMEQHVAQEFRDILNELSLTEESAKSKFVALEKLGIDKKEKEFLKELFKESKNVTDLQKSNAVQLKRLGFEKEKILSIINNDNASDIVKEETLKKFGIDKAFVEKIKNEPATKDDLVKIRQACKNAPNVRIGKGHVKLLGPLQLFGRKVSLSEVGNKLTSIGEANTKTGKLLSTFLQKCHRGFTFGGGKMNVMFFVAPFLVESMINVKKADPEQKLSTAAHGLIHSVSWVFTFPLAVNILYRLGGLRYAGMSKEAVEDCRNKIKAFNEKANPYIGKRSFFDKLFGRGDKKSNGETFQSYAEYKDAKKALKKVLKDNYKVKDQNLLTKIGRGIGKFITMDLETISPYKNGNFFMNKLRGTGNLFRNVGGVPMKFLLWAGISMGVLDTIINKGLKTCFGGHYDGMVEEEFENKKKEQKDFLKEDLRTRLYNAQEQKVMGLGSVSSNTEDNVNITPDAVVNDEQLVQSTENDIRPDALENSDLKKNNTTVEANNLETQSKKIDDYTYIPSSDAIKLKQSQKAKLDNYTYIPSAQNVLAKSLSKNNVSKYIPSQRASNITKTYDNSGLKSAFARADLAEENALKVLSGDFDKYQ